MDNFVFLITRSCSVSFPKSWKTRSFAFSKYHYWGKGVARSYPGGQSPGTEI